MPAPPRHRARGLVIPALLLTAWTLAGTTPERAFYFVPPWKLGVALRDLVVSGELFGALVASLGKALLGLGLGGLGGLLVGVALASCRPLDRALGPTLHAFRQVPLLGLAPLLGLWLGNGDAPRGLMVLLAVFFPLLLNSHEGVRHLDGRLLEVARVCGMPRRRVFTTVVLPGIAPFLFTGLSQAVAFSWLATIGSELVFTAGNGVGTIMLTAQAAARMDVVLVCVATIGLVGVLVNGTVRRLGRRFMRWRDLAEAT